MCKSHNPSRRDKCLRMIIDLINGMTKYKTLASCCGHGRYPMTIVVTRGYGKPIEYFSQKEIPRKKRFYVRDKKGYYFIPEVKNDKQR